MNENKKEEYLENLDFSESIISEKEAKEIKDIQKEFLESYITSKDELTIEEWLPQELEKQLPQNSKEEIVEMSNEIIISLKITEEKKVSLQEAIEAGRSRESWLASTLVQSTSHMSAQESTKYLQGLDDAVRNANQEMYDTITTKSGVISQNPNLDGFIAEQHHVNSYNMKAKATGGELYAEVLKPKPGETYSKNSVDIVIRDISGKIKYRYQVKYGATAEETIKMIKQGDYKGQRLIVPKEQVEAVQKAFPNRKVSATIGEGDIKSKPLTKQQAKELQKKAQTKNWLDADWNDYLAKDIAMGIGKQAGQACLQGVAVGAGMTLVSKVCKGEEIDGEEVVKNAIVSGADFGVKTATAGALKVACEKGILKAIPKGTKGSTFANIAFVAVENVKVLGKVVSGELTAKEGVDVMQQTTGACLAGLVASAKGSALGATIGTVLGPIGSAVGGFVGGTLGYMAGSKIGQSIVKGAQKVCDVAKDTIKTVGRTVWSGITSVENTIFGFSL